MAALVQLMAVLYQKTPIYYNIISYTELIPKCHPFRSSTNGLPSQSHRYIPHYLLP